MAAIIQLRRGSSPSSLSYGEPYINDDSASLVVRLSGSNDIITLAKLEQKNNGNIWIDGDLTASNISASGDIRIGGQLFLGDAAEDAVVIQGSLSSSLIPESGSTYNIGSSAKPWNNLHIGQIFATTTVVTSSAQITAFGFVSSSTDISSINSFTQSADQRLDSLESDSGSYLTSSGSVSYDDITSKPTLLSGSAQITAFGFTSSSTNITSLNTFTSSADQRLDSLEGDSGSYLTSLDGGIVSSSAQITSLGFISESSENTSLNSFTQSFNTAITLNSDDVTILGNLTVQGTETILNTQTLEVEDKNILVASGAADSAAANGAGLTIDGANKSLQWNHTDSQFRFNADVSASAFYGDGSNLTNVGAPLTSLNSFTASNGNDSLNAFTSSNNNDSLNAATSSYLTSSGSVDYSDLTSVPSSIVSSSAQITAFGFVSSSGGNLTSLNAFTQSADQRLDSLEGESGSYLTSSGSVDYSDITSVPSSIVSSSAQITAFGFISSSHTDITSLNSYTSSTDDRLDNIESTTSSLEQRVGQIESNTGSYDDLTNISSLNTFTGSADQRLDSLENASGSYLTSSGSVDYSDITSLPTLVSQSNQVNYNNLLNKPAFIGGTNVTITSASNGVTINSTGGGGGSADLSHLNAFTQSANTRFQQLSADTGSQNQRLDSLESESGSYLTSVPNAHINTSLNTFTSSADQRLDSIESESGSYLTSVPNEHINTSLNSITSSFDQRLDSLEGESGSYISNSDTSSMTVNSASIAEYTSEWNLTADGSNHYVFQGPGFTGSASDPNIYLVRGQKYKFTNNMGAHPFRIQTTVNGAAGTQYNNGVTNNDVSNGTLIFDVPMEAPNVLYYQCTAHANMGGAIFISHNSGSNIPNGTVSGSEQITDLGFISGSSVSSSISYNGNRVISQAHLQGFYTSSFNAGTSGSIIDFLDAIFFPNTEPSISSGNQTIAEFSASSSPIFTLEATDPEAQSITFGTASSYTDDLVRVASNGVVTLNALAESSSFNTDLVGGSHGHTFTATATDTFNATVEKDITIFVTPNAAPIFRETSVGGNQITNVTANLNENSADDTLVKRVFFTDAEGDTITIDSSSVSPANHFSITKYSTYVDIRQNTGSLDYETYPLYTFSLSASDEHYQNSQDSDSISVLPVSISVVDNVHPTINNQTLSSISENSSNGATVGNISATDSEGDSITFSQFTLYKLELDNVDVSSGSYGGTSQATDPHENPFQMNSAGQVTRKTGVYLNSDLINEYQYLVTVRDAYNTASNEAIVTIPITDDTPATLSDNWSAGPYIIESAVSGALIRVSSNGFSGTQADYGSNQSGTFTSSNPAIAINSSNGQLSLALDLSGSTTQSGDSISSTITFTNSFGTTTTDSLTVSVAQNAAPDIIFVSSSILNTNQASASSEELVSIRFSDTEGDSVDTDSFTFTEPTGQLTASLSGSSFKVTALSQLSGSTTYGFTASIEDEHHFRTNTESQAITITQSDTGTLGGDTTSYIIESAVSGAVLRDATGYNNGNASQLTVSYSPSHGSPSVQSFTSSNPAIAVDNSGNLTLALNLSGSTTSSGDTISTDITFDDQYGNTGSGSVTVNVFANSAPTATFTEHPSNFNTDTAVNGVTMVSMSISDTESDTPFSASISGSDLQLVFTNANSSSVGIQATTSLTQRVYTYSVSVFDQFGKSTTYSDRTFSVTQSADYGKVYIYRSNYGSDAGLNSNYPAVMGIDTTDSSTPPEITGFSANDTSPMRLISSSLGESTLSLAGGKQADLVATLSGSHLDTILSASSPYTMGSAAEQYIIVVPSGSDMIGIPTSMRNSFGGSTAGEYVLVQNNDNGGFGVEGAEIHLLDTSGSINGYDKHFVIGRKGHTAAASVVIRLIESSGSLPS